MASPVPAPKTPLTGKGSNTSTPRQEVGTPDWSMAEVQEFIPQGFEGAHMVSLLYFRVFVSSCCSFRGLFFPVDWNVARFLRGCHSVTFQNHSTSFSSETNSISSGNGCKGLLDDGGILSQSLYPEFERHCR